MEFYKSKIIQGDFDNSCKKINIGFFNSGFRMLIENNLQNQIKLELGVSTPKCKILGAADLPIDLMKLNPFDSTGNIIYFKLMIFEIDKELLKISAIEPVLQTKFQMDSQFTVLISEVKLRISNLIDHLLNDQYLNYQDTEMQEYYLQ